MNDLGTLLKDTNAKQFSTDIAIINQQLKSWGLYVDIKSRCRDKFGKVPQEIESKIQGRHYKMTRDEFVQLNKVIDILIN